MVGCERSLIISNTQESWLEILKLNPNRSLQRIFSGKFLEF